MANSSGGLVSRIRYYPYGNARYESPSSPTDKLFTDQQRESANGLYHYGARMYNADIGRFVQADTVLPDRYDPQGLNSYSYVLNNPPNYTDPTGLVPMDDGSHGGPVWRFYPAPGSVPDWIPVPFDLLNPPNSGGLGILDVFEALPFFGVGDLTSALRFGNSCYDASCDWWYAIGMAPIIPGNLSSLARTLARFSDETGDAARMARVLRDGTLSYREAAKLTKGEQGLIQAHHILEQRHMLNWKYSPKEIVEAPAMVMSKEEHDLLTRQLRRELPYGHEYSRAQVWSAYQRVYGERYPEALGSIERYLR